MYEKSQRCMKPSDWKRGKEKDRLREKTKGGGRQNNKLVTCRGTKKESDRWMFTSFDAYAPWCCF